MFHLFSDDLKKEFLDCDPHNPPVLTCKKSASWYDLSEIQKEILYRLGPDEWHFVFSGFQIKAYHELVSTGWLSWKPIPLNNVLKSDPSPRDWVVKLQYRDLFCRVRDCDAPDLTPNEIGFLKNLAAKHGHKRISQFCKGRYWEAREKLDDYRREQEDQRLDLDSILKKILNSVQ